MAGWAVCLFEYINVLSLATTRLVTRKVIMGYELLKIVPLLRRLRSEALRKKSPESSSVKPPRRDTQALSPAGMFGGKKFAPMRCTPAYLLCEWGV